MTLRLASLLLASVSLSSSLALSAHGDDASMTKKIKDFLIFASHAAAPDAKEKASELTTELFATAKTSDEALLRLDWVNFTMRNLQNAGLFSEIRSYAPGAEWLNITMEARILGNLSFSNELANFLTFSPSAANNGAQILSGLADDIASDILEAKATDRFWNEASPNRRVSRLEKILLASDPDQSPLVKLKLQILAEKIKSFEVRRAKRINYYVKTLIQVMVVGNLANSFLGVVDPHAGIALSAFIGGIAGTFRDPYQKVREQSLEVLDRLNSRSERGCAPTLASRTASFSATN